MEWVWASVLMLEPRKPRQQVNAGRDAPAGFLHLRFVGFPQSA
uniref:Uncharacterized protein n=1 Tax=uncultured bacterium A1Q1_fos_2059 TaxID=1256559 RepID=L7VZJ5_9BACT|nr:hypothetical protein [uncultured bacterium A1Q1_fos_2059]